MLLEKGDTCYLFECSSVLGLVNRVPSGNNYLRYKMASPSVTRINIGINKVKKERVLDRKDAM